MKLPNTKRGWPAGEPNEHWTSQQFLALLRNQHALLTASDSTIREAVAATDEDIREIEADIAAFEANIAHERAKLN